MSLIQPDPVHQPPVAAATSALVLPRAKLKDPCQEEPEFAQFVKAIGLGVAIGVPVLAAIIFGIVMLAAPDWGIGPAVGAAVWVSLWSGLFLGGTVTVGLWSNRLH